MKYLRCPATSSLGNSFALQRLSPLLSTAPVDLGWAGLQQQGSAQSCSIRSYSQKGDTSSSSSFHESPGTNGEQKHYSARPSQHSFFHDRWEDASRERRYQTLSTYLDQLPPVIRELLLWSPLLALLYFICCMEAPYYRRPNEPIYYLLYPQWLRQRRGVMQGPSSLLSQPPADIHGAASSPADGALLQQTADAILRADGAGGTVFMRCAVVDVDGASAPFIPAYHSVVMRGSDSSSDSTTASSSSPAAATSTPARGGNAEGITAIKNGVWEGPLRVVRDSKSGLIVGYTISRSSGVSAY